MVKVKILFSILIFSLTISHASAQTVNIDTLLVGTWKGTSKCQVKNSPCKDEVSVYYISKDKTPDMFNVDGRKLVNGVEEEMGILTFNYNKQTKQLLLTSERGGTWTLNVKPGKIEGTLVWENQVYRVVNLAKQY